MPNSIRNHRHHLDKKLRIRIILYFMISIILLGIFLFNVLEGSLRLDFGLIGMSIGTLIGIIASRMFHTAWDHDAKKVVSRLDAFGIVILIFYIILELLRNKVVGFFTHDFETETIGLAVLSGIMVGRVIGSRGKIIDVLKEQKILR